MANKPMNKPVLVIMAAGMSSRYGGLKQVAEVGPKGQILMEYAVYDALKAGFSKVIFVIREAIEEEFKEVIAQRFRGTVKLEYAYQRIDDLPAGTAAPEDRHKPWGTAHAILSSRHRVRSPFAVINADDYYGPSAYTQLFDFLVNAPDGGYPAQYCLAGYQLKNTLTEHGTVARGICQVNASGWLSEIHERTKIKAFGDEIRYFGEDDTWHVLPFNATASMNAWGLTPAFFEKAELGFSRFLKTPGKELSFEEYYLPAAIHEQITDGSAKVRVLPCSERWYGMTYPDDVESVRSALAAFTRQGMYPEDLWGSGR